MAGHAIDSGRRKIRSGAIRAIADSIPIKKEWQWQFFPAENGRISVRCRHAVHG